MTSPLLGVGEDQITASLVDSSASVNSDPQNELLFKEHNYLGLPDCSSVDSSSVSGLSDANKINFNVKATELRLGLPGTQSPERELNVCLHTTQTVDEKPLFHLLPLKDDICSPSHNVSGNKRGFTETICGFSKLRDTVYIEKNWMFHSDGSDFDAMQSVVHDNFFENSLASRQSTLVKNVPQKTVSKEQPDALKGRGTASAAKAQVVGWPPIRSFRKNILVASSKDIEEVNGKLNSGTLFVKVSMDGAPYLRKVDLRSYTSYHELSSALEKMFSCFTIVLDKLGRCGSDGSSRREVLSESKVRDLLHGCEYVLTYEDKEGDWMLVGDVPWEMFIGSCKKLKIMKSSEAIGLGVYVCG